VYWHDRPDDGACACRVIEELDCPIADALDIAPSTFAEHLAAAQRKLLEETLAAD